MKKIDLTGALVGALRVTAPASSRKKKTYWTAVCTLCNRTSEYRADTLTGSNPTARCICADRRRTHGATAKRGNPPDPLYLVWTAVKRRVKLQPYAYRIELQEEWQDFIPFREAILSSIGARPSKRHSLDRIDQTGGYARSNVKWSTDAEQASNRTSSRIYECPELSVALTAYEWSRFINEVAGTGRWTATDVRAFLERLKLSPWQMIRAVIPAPPDRQHEAGRTALAELIQRFDHQGWWDCETENSEPVVTTRKNL